MKTFKIVNGDLVMDESMNFVMIEGIDEIGQSIEVTLNTNIKEWFLNTLHGLDYDKIRGKGRTKEEIELAIRTAVLQEPRVLEIEDVEIKIDDRLRRLEVYFKILTIDGPLEIREVVEVE